MSRAGSAADRGLSLSTDYKATSPLELLWEGAGGVVVLLKFMLFRQ